MILFFSRGREVTYFNIYSIGQNFKLQIIWRRLRIPKVFIFLLCEILLHEIHVDVPAKYSIVVHSGVCQSQFEISSIQRPGLNLQYKRISVTGWVKGRILRKSPNCEMGPNFRITAPPTLFYCPAHFLRRITLPFNSLPALLMEYAL